MKIDFYCRPGSQSFVFTPPDVWGRGVGGAELSLITLAEALVRRGHEVTVYNVPTDDYGEDKSGVYDGVRYEFAVPRFEVNGKRDVFVLFRNPFEFIDYVEADVKLFWSCDQMTAGDYAKDIYPKVDKGVCISEFHKRDHVERYGVSGDAIEVIDLGVRLGDYGKTLPKVPGKIIFCSVPHRGLPQLRPIWNKLVELHPNISLYITSDYRLWGRGIGPNDAEMRDMWLGMGNVHYLGAVPRDTLITHQLTSELCIYPHWPVNGFPELFGISLAECMAAGCVPIVSAIGGLTTTVAGGGVILSYDPRTEYGQERFVRTADRLLGNDELMETAGNTAIRSSKRFNWDRIAGEWEGLIERIRHDKG